MKNILFTVFMAVFTTLSYSQTCDIEVKTTNASCSTSADGSAEIWYNGSLVVIDNGGNSTGCVTPEVSPKNCTIMETGAIASTQTSGTLTIQGGQIVYLTSDFTGNIQIEQGGAVTLVLCGTTNIGSFNINETNAPVNIYINGSSTVTAANLNLNPNITVHNYGGLSVQTAGFNGSFVNHAPFTAAGSFSVNALSANLYNTSSMNIGGAFNISSMDVVTNSGTINVGGSLHNNSNGSLLNNCTITINGAYTQDSYLNNNGTITVGGSLSLNSGKVDLGGGSLITANTLSINTTVEGISQNCAAIQVQGGNTTINGSATLQGHVDVCPGTGTFVNNGQVVSPATVNCSCSPSGNTGSGNGVEGTITWSSGTPILNGSTVTNLSPDTYTVSVDIEGCPPELFTFTIDANENITASATLVNDIATVTTNATGTLSYIWSDGVTLNANTRDMSTLVEGTYCVVVKTNSGCESNASCVMVTDDNTTPTCGVSVSYATDLSVTVSSSTTTGCCEWQIETPTQSYVTSYTFDRPCADTIIKLKNCEGEYSEIEVSGNAIICTTDNTVCPDPTNPDCPQQTCPDVNNPACCQENGTCCENTLNVVYTETAVGTVVLTPQAGSGQYFTYNPINNQKSLIVSGLPTGNTTITIVDATTGQSSCVEVTVTNGDPINTTPLTVSLLSGCSYQINAPSTFVAPITYEWQNPVNGEPIANTAEYHVGSQAFIGQPLYLKVQARDANNQLATGTLTIPSVCYPTGCHPSDPFCPTGETPQLTITYTSTARKCGQPSTTILSVSGGSGDYVTTNDEQFGQQHLYINDLSSGPHLITVYDRVKKIEETIWVVVPESPKTTINLVNETDPLVGLNNSVTLAVSGASEGNYIIELDFAPHYQNIPVTNGSLGTYTLPTDRGNGPFTITVRDQYCHYYSFEAYRQQTTCTPVGYSPQVTKTLPSTAGQQNGSLTVTNLPSGATAQWRGTTFVGKRVTSSLTGLGAGTYYLTILDPVHECVVIASETIVLEDGGSLGSYTFTVDASGCEATIQPTLRDSEGNVLPISSTPTYKWINPYTHTTVSTAATLDVSTLTLVDNPPYLIIELQDVEGHKGKGKYVIPAQCQPVSTCEGSITYEAINPTCQGDNSGMINITDVSSNSYIIWRDNQSYNTTRANLVAGAYTVEQIIEGCTTPHLYTINLLDPAPIEVSTIEQGPTSLEVVVNNGTAPYSYKWADEDDSRDDNIKTDLTPGVTYTVTVTDVKGCTGSYSFLHDPCGANSMSLAIIDNQPDDESIAIVSGGIAPYEYNWRKTTGSLLVNPYGRVKYNLPYATYEVTVTDAQGCETSTLYTPTCNGIEGEIDVVINQQASQSDRCDAVVSLDIQLGEETDYQVLWNEQKIEELLASEDGLQAIEIDSKLRIINVCSGEHEVLVYQEGDNSCGLIKTFEVEGPTPPPSSCDNSTLTITPQNGTSFTKQTASEQTPIHISVKGGEMPYTYTWRYTSAGNIEEITSYQPGFKNALPGEYLLIVKDKNDCETTETFTVTGATEELDVTETLVHPTCAQGTGEVTLETIGGIGTKTILWNDNNTSFSRNDLVEGETYSYEITDEAGATKAGSITMNTVRFKTSLSASTQEICSGSSTTLMAQYEPTYTILWSSTTVTIENPSADVLNVTEAGAYTLTRTNPNCPTITETVTVSIKTDCEDTQTPCESYTYSVPAQPEDNSCASNMLFSAQAEALHQYDDYLTAIKENFTNQYRASVMESVEESLVMSFTDKEEHYTLYYYDQAGNLTRTVPPAGVRALNAEQTASVEAYWKGETNTRPDVHTEHTLATTYQYNSLNQLVAQDVPDHEQQDLWTMSQQLTIDENIVALNASGNNVWVFANDADKAYLYSSEDGGNTYTNGLQLELGDIKDITRAGATGETYYAVGTEGLLLKASNGPANWQVLPAPVKTTFIKAYFPQPDKGIIFTASGEIYKTVDGGINWTTVTTSTQLNTQNTGGLATALSGKTISDIKIINDAFYITAQDNTAGVVYTAPNAGNIIYNSTLSLSQIEVVMPTVETMTYVGNETKLIANNYLYTSVNNTITPQQALQGVSGTISAYETNGTVSLIKSTSGIYISTDGVNYTLSTLAVASTIHQVNGQLYVTNQNDISTVANDGTLTALSTNNKTLSGYYYENGNDYLLLNNNSVENVTTNTTYDLIASNVYYVTDMVVKDGVIIVEGNSNIYTLTSPTTLSTPITGYTGLSTVGDKIYATNSQNYYEITIQDAAQSTITIATTPVTQTVPSHQQIAYSDELNTYQYIDYNNIIWTVTNGSTPVKTTVADNPVYATAIGDNTRYTTGNDGILYAHQSDYYSYKMVIEPTNITGAITQATTDNNQLKVATASEIYTYSNAMLTSVQATEAASISENYVLSTTGTVYQDGVQEATLENYEVINAEASTTLAAGQNTQISYNATGTWQIANPIEVAPIQAVASNENTIVAVGEEGTIIKSENQGESFTIIAGPSTQTLTSVAIRNNGFVVSDAQGNIYHYENGETPTVATVLGSATPSAAVQKIHTNPNNSVWILRGKELLYSATGTNYTVSFTAPEQLNDITFATANYGYLIGNSGTAYRIHPTGTVEEANAETTIAQSIGDNKSIQPITVDNNLTDDQGTNLPPSHLQSIQFTDKLVGYLTAPGMVLKTIDGGYHWQLEGNYTGQPLIAQTTDNNNVYSDDNTLGTVEDNAMSLSTRFWYDELGRLVLSQNAKQYNIENYLSEHQYEEVTVPGMGRIYAYSYTLYDDIGRITEVGELLTREELTTYKYESQVKYNTHETVFTQSGVKVQITKTYYDRAAFNGITANFTQSNLRPRVASVTYQQYANTDYDRATHYSYDIHGNVKTLLQEIKRVELNDIGQVQPVYKRIDYDYDLISGNVNHVYFQKGQTDAFTHRYEYDGDNRIKEVYTSTDEIIWNKEANYDYYAHGPLARVTTGRDDIDQCDYAYTIHGWVKGVNSQNFAYALGYYEESTNKDYQSIGTNNLQATPMATNLYNGNISTMSTHTPAFATAGEETTFIKQFKYDQLNRIKEGNVQGSTTNAFKTTYSYDANGNIESLNRYNAQGQQFDAMAYHYHGVDEGYLKNTNKLRWVDDNPGTSEIHTSDIEDQDRDNYHYDEIGNLIEDQAEEIERIEWTVSGKVHAVIRTAASGKDNLYFSYDAMGNRISKKSINADGKVKVTYYIREASGNTMATYQKTTETPFTLKEQHLYGSERLGMYQPKTPDAITNISSHITQGSHHIGNRSYEFKDHLGNVHLVLSDRKQTSTYDNTLAAYEYYPFGMAMQTYETDAYRYGFNGKEKDDEWNGSGNSYDFGARIYDARLGRWYAIDPQKSKYPHLSPYNFAGNVPTKFVDYDGENYGVYIDHEKKTIIIKATIHTTKGEAAKLAQEAAAKWNNESNNYSYNTGENKYNIQFDITVKEYDTEAEAEKAYKTDDSGESNILKTVNLDKEEPKINGEVKSGDNNDQGIILVNNSQTVGKSGMSGKQEAYSRGTHKHELGHALGLGHFTNGLMEQGGTRSDGEDYITTGMISRILINSEAIWTTTETISDMQIDKPNYFKPEFRKVHETGKAPKDFKNGKVGLSLIGFFRKWKDLAKQRQYEEEKNQEPKDDK